MNKTFPLLDILFGKQEHILLGIFNWVFEVICSKIIMLPLFKHEFTVTGNILNCEFKIKF